MSLKRHASDTSNELSRICSSIRSLVCRSCVIHACLCRQAHGSAHRTASEFPQVTFAKCDVDKAGPIAARYQYVPYLLVPVSGHLRLPMQSLCHAHVQVHQGRSASRGGTSSVEHTHLSRVPCSPFGTMNKVRGADGNGLRGTLQQHAGPASAGSSSTSAHGKSLLAHIDKPGLSCLNEVSSHTLRDLLGNGYLESDADEQVCPFPDPDVTTGVLTNCVQLLITMPVR